MGYLVTGTAGFIGWKTSQRLIEKREEVIGVDNLNEYYDVRLKIHRLEELKKNESFRFYQVDIENLKDLDHVFQNNKIDAIFNLAARAGVRFSMENPHIYISTNVQGTLNLLELMRKYKVKKMVLASTSSLYAGGEMPFREDRPVNTPISPYAASKKAAEVMSYTYHYLFGLDISVLRFFTVFGPAGRPDMSIFRFIKWIDEEKPIILFGDGSQSRDFTYVDDVADGTLKAIKEVNYDIINIGGGRNPKSLKYIISRLEEYLSKKAIIEYRPFHKADMKETWADISKAWKILRWKPEVDLDVGLKRTVDWYIENRNWLSKIKL